MSYHEIRRGDDRTLTVTASESMENADLTFTAKRARRDPDADAVIQKTTGAGITIAGTPFLTAEIVIEAADTDDLDDVPVALHWDLQLQLASEVHTIAQGRLAVLQDITRDV